MQFRVSRGVRWWYLLLVIFVGSTISHKFLGLTPSASMAFIVIWIWLCGLGLSWAWDWLNPLYVILGGDGRLSLGGMTYAISDIDAVVISPRRTRGMVLRLKRRPWLPIYMVAWKTESDGLSKAAENWAQMHRIRVVVR